MRVFIFFILCAFGIPAYTQQFNFVNYSIEDGLPQSQVTDILQDRFGYLWIGTETGLSRFDGIQFVNFSTDDGLPDNEIDKIYLDESGSVWIATPKGIAKYTNRIFESYPFSDSLNTEYRINDLCEINEQLFIAADEGLMIFHNSDFRFVEDNIDQFGSIRSLVNSGDTILFCGTKSGLFQFKNDHFVRFENAELDSVNISDLFLRKNELLISTYGHGLIQFNLETNWVTRNSLPVNRIRSIHANGNSVVCATKNGCIEIDTAEVNHYTVNNGLNFENIRSVFIDREGNIWLGSDGKGLFKLTGKSVTYFTKKDGLSSDAVMSVSQDQAGIYYFGTYDAGVTIWTKDSLRHETKILNLELKNSTIWITLNTVNGKCFIGSSEGIDVLGSGAALTDHPATNINSKIRSLVYLNDSTFLAGGSEGIFKISDREQKIFIRDLDVNKMVVANGEIYCAANTGLFKTDLSGNYKIIELPENNVKSAAMDRLGNLWIGTNSSGVFVLKKDGGIFPFVLDRTDSKSKTILGIICDQSGDMWISTMNGVYQILLNEEGENDFSINHFGRAEGLITLECNQNALYEDRENFIWVGTSEGLVRINPSMNDELFRFRKPEMIITGVRLFMEDFEYSSFDNLMNNETGVPQSITFPYNKNHLTFDFIGINLKDPQGVKYEYRLLGAEEFWSPLTADNYATYSFISHGEYDFEVRAINASGNWSEISRMHIIILPPFWLTWWFILLAITGGIIILILIFRARIKVITQKQENERLEFKNRLLFLEQQSLNASMNRHFIFNSLNSIQYFINSSNKLAANKYLTSFAKLIRKNLDSSQANNFIVTLKEELERIELYLSLEKMRFEGKFEYITEIDDDIETESIEIPSMILQPFVENSIIHGVLPLERKGTIRLRIYMEFDFLVFEVIDDGIGIDDSLAMKKNRKADDAHESMGIEITNRRIDLLRKLTGENLMIIGPFQINNEEGKSLGTKVIIKIFVSKNETE